MIYVGSYVEGLDINQISAQLLAGQSIFIHCGTFIADLYFRDSKVY